MNIPKDIFFTQEGYKKLQDDETLLQEQRKEAIVHLQKAREMGDLSENGYYKAAKAKVSSIDHQLHRIRYLIRFGKITKNTATDSIQMSSTFIIFEGGQEKQLTLVGEHEANPSEGKISIKSPLGSALVGKKQHDTFLVQTPSGEKTYQVKSIL